ncbi:hypothetical protein [Victivallis sp. Marseille-Q1083]|uniref:hypothetical protein n=1 Tax=Victivallis sp. Marseille-Q1083 TaxID=2717288 RepID=UPI001589CE54|nr:hypothetical protein [Victivallis sp. Marseille-Q1083]
MKKQFSGLLILIIWCAGCFGVFAENGHYFREFDGELEVVKRAMSDIAYCRCGYPHYTVNKSVSFATSIEDMAIQLHWRLIGPNTWQQVYQEPVSVPGLDFSPHNKTGYGSYSNFLEREVVVVYRYRQEYDEKGNKVGAPQTIKSTYACERRWPEPKYIPCTTHNIE